MSYFGELEDILQFPHVMSDEGAPVVDIHLVKDIPGLHHGLDVVLYPSQDVLKGLTPGKGGAGVLYSLLEPIVPRAC
ncbi:hypothetical protein MASR2M17_04130 [Aminivibrio sp.]